MQRRRRGLDLGLGFLFFNIYQFGLDNIPPVTLTVLGLNVYLFLKPLKPLEYCCISVNEVYYERDWERFLLAPFHHVDDWHLYFNMLSLIWKGSTLERRLGSALFAKIIVVFSLLTDVVYVLLEFLLSEITHDEYYMIQCAVGFSGVLFALKVLINHYYPGWSIIIFDIQVPNKYACWAELVLIYLLIPNASFVGHLSGILVGLLYIHGPLEKILKKAGYARHDEYQSQGNGAPGTDDMNTGGLNEEEQLQQAIRESLNNPGHARHDEYQSQGNGAPGTDDMNTGELSEEEQLQQAIRMSLNNPACDAPQEELSLEELRRLRLNRFTRRPKPKTRSVLGKEFSKLDYL